MSIQTEIKNEKALFSELIKKIKKSKTFKAQGVTDRSKAKAYNFDTFDIVVYLDKIKLPDEVIEKYLTDDAFYILGTSLEFASKIIVRGQKGKLIIEKDCRPLDVEGEALEIQKVRYQMAEKILNIIDDREEKLKEKLKEEQKRLEEAKAKGKRLSATKTLRKKQQAEAALTLKALEAIKSL